MKTKTYQERIEALKLKKIFSNDQTALSAQLLGKIYKFFELSEIETEIRKTKVKHKKAEN